MKYLLLVYSSEPDRWEHPIFVRQPAFRAMPPAEREAFVRQSEELWAEITGSGELVSGTALADPVLTRTVQVQDGVPVITDGPFLEAKEELAGYFVLDCPSRDRVEEIAARFPDVRFGRVEIRPIMDMSGQEM
jgi:hypothetical protein